MSGALYQMDTLSKAMLNPVTLRQTANGIADPTDPRRRLYGETGQKTITLNPSTAGLLVIYDPHTTGCAGQVSLTAMELNSSGTPTTGVALHKISVGNALNRDFRSVKVLSGAFTVMNTSNVETRQGTATAGLLLDTEVALDEITSQHITQAHVGETWYNEQVQGNFGVSVMVPLGTTNGEQATRLYKSKTISATDALGITSLSNWAHSGLTFAKTGSAADNGIALTDSTGVPPNAITKIFSTDELDGTSYEGNRVVKNEAFCFQISGQAFLTYNNTSVTEGTFLVKAYDISGALIAIDQIAGATEISMGRFMGTSDEDRAETVFFDSNRFLTNQPVSKIEVYVDRQNSTGHNAGNGLGTFTNVKINVDMWCPNNNVKEIGVALFEGLAASSSMSFNVSALLSTTQTEDAKRLTPCTLR